MARKHYHEHTAPAGHDHTIPSDIPFRENLVFYAPLANEICNCDYVSGVIPIVEDNNGSTTEYCQAEWDATEGAWKLTSIVPTSTRYGYNAGCLNALKYLGLQMWSGVGTDNRANTGITLFCRVKDIARQGNCYEDYMSCDECKTAAPTVPYTNLNTNSNTIVSTAMMIDINSYNLNLRAVNNSTDLYQQSWTNVAATTTNGSDCKWYKDGVIKRTASNWTGNMKGNPTSVGLCCCRANQFKLICYIKDVRIYNRVLTQAEIQTL